MAPAKPQPKAKSFKIPKADVATIALLDEAMADRPGLRRGQMFGCPGFFLGTKAVAIVFGEGVTITLPPARVEALIKENGYRPFVAAGRAMTGWMIIDQEQLQRLDPSDGIYDEAIAYARAKAEKAVPSKTAVKSTRPKKQAPTKRATGRATKAAKARK